MSAGEGAGAAGAGNGAPKASSAEAEGRALRAEGETPPVAEAPKIDRAGNPVNPIEDEQAVNVMENPPIEVTANPGEGMADLEARAGLIGGDVSPSIPQEAVAAETPSPAAELSETMADVPTESVVEGGGAKAAPVAETPAEAIEPEIEQPGTGQAPRSPEPLPAAPAETAGAEGGAPADEPAEGEAPVETAPNEEVVLEPERAVKEEEAESPQAVPDATLPGGPGDHGELQAAPARAGEPAPAPTRSEEATGDRQPTEGGAPAGVEREAETGASSEGRAGMTPPPAEAVSSSKEEKLKQEIATALQGNEEYQAAKQALEGDANKRWRDIDALPEDQRDVSIDGLKGGDKQAYEKYVKEREQVHGTQREAEYDAQERLLDERAAAGEDVSGDRQKLETKRRKEGEDANLAINEKYQTLQRKYRGVEQKMLQRYDDGRRSSEEIAGLIRDWAVEKRSWQELNPEEQELFGNEFTYKNYRDDRGLMNGAESSAKSKVESNRLDENYNPDGTKITGTPEQIRTRKKQLLEGSVMKEKYQGPGRVRRGFRWLNRAIDNIAGKAPMEDHRKKAFNHARKLISDYGFWRGLVVPQKDQAKILRELMLKELIAYGWRSGIRKSLITALLLAAYWVVLPVAIGKTLDMVKPFGGNG